jgi:hypothetical protein
LEKRIVILEKVVGGWLDRSWDGGLLGLFALPGVLCPSEGEQGYDPGDTHSAGFLPGFFRE